MQVKGIRSISPYVPGEQPNFSDMIKINTNENAYPPAPAVLDTLKHFDGKSLSRYSSISNQKLKEALAKKYHLQSNQFVIGNGSDEILAFCMLAFFNSQESILFPDITYGFYKVWADLFHIPYQEVPLNQDFRINLEDYNLSNGGIVIPNPNAPTGIYEERPTIETLLKNNKDSVVIIDEAYIDFGGVSVLPLIEKYPNLVVVHTFSKSRSLAGLRIGYAISNPNLIQILESIKSSFNPYSVDTLSEELAVSAVESHAYYLEINQKIQHTREVFAHKLKQLGFVVLPSRTNFVLTTHPKADMQALFEFLNEQHVFVRFFPTNKRLKQFFRISIGTDQEMIRVIQVLEQFLSK